MLDRECLVSCELEFYHGGKSNLHITTSVFPYNKLG